MSQANIKQRIAAQQRDVAIDPDAATGPRYDSSTDGFARMVRDAQGEMRGYQMHPAMRAVAERCSTGRIVTMTSKVTEEAEIRRRAESGAR